MKKEKTWFGFDRYMPTSKWEADYFLGLKRNQLALSAIIWATVVILSVMLLAMICQPCQIEMSGNAIGNAVLNNPHIDGVFREMRINNLQGDIKLNVPCYVLGELR